MMMFDRKWFEGYAKALLEDPEWRVIGKYFNCTYLIDAEGDRFILTFYNGELKEINDTPLVGPLYNQDSWDFAIRAPKETWSKYISKIPPAKYHHFFAITDFKTPQRMIVEGNMKIVWQNIRALTHAMEFMRVFSNKGGF